MRGFQFYLVEDDDLLVDHACLWSCAHRNRPLDEMFFTARDTVEKQLGAPHFDGVWPTVEGGSSGDVWRVSIWRHGSGLLILQQDDFQHLQFPEMIGFEVDVCLLNYDLERELPRQRTWRLRGEGRMGV